MRVLVINAGSSSIKFDLIDLDRTGRNQKRIAQGVVENLGRRSRLHFAGGGRDTRRGAKSIRRCGEAVRAFAHWWDDNESIAAIGHRVVHGGSQFFRAMPLGPPVLRELQALEDLAPLHNPPAIEGIRAAQKIFGRGKKMVAVFDTGFHQTIPDFAAQYALPWRLAKKHGLRRYGFHGIAHESMLHGFARLTGTEIRRAKLITLQLGNGCSITAIRNGKSVDTSMGFTPLEGLMMGTRSGDIDPGLVQFLGAREKLGVEEVEEMLNKKSGLLGVSGLSHDIRDLIAVARTNRRAALALKMFCYRARKYLGAYLAALHGADGIIFGGGIGEHQPVIRRQICGGLEKLGLCLDDAANRACRVGEGRISAARSAIPIYVVTVNEAALIAEKTVRTTKLQ
jgi:acetate kinase